MRAFQRANCRASKCGVSALGLALALLGTNSVADEVPQGAHPAPTNPVVASPEAASEPPAISGAQAIIAPERPSKERGASTLFLGGLGLLALPGAEVCPFTDAECEPGETALSLAVQAHGRVKSFGVGVGLNWAAGLRPSKAAGDPDGALERQHSRSYFIVEGNFRYYLPVLGAWDWWLGASAGGVVISDSWSTIADREPYADTAFVGPRAVTLATEGLSFGLSVGGHWRFSEQLVFGTQLQYSNWLLPTERERTPVGDLASLAGRVDVFSLGLIGGFELPL